MSGNLPVRYFTPETGAAMTCRTLNKLASQTGMSRAAFAKHFGQTVGITPIESLTQWRMLLASDRLQNSGETISGVLPHWDMSLRAPSEKHLSVLLALHQESKFVRKSFEG